MQENTPVAIIISTYNNLFSLQRTINSIIDNTYYPHYRIILVNPPSKDGTNEFCDYLAKIYKNVKSFHPKTETSIQAYNYGIKKTNLKEDVFLIHDDVIIPKLISRNWLYEMVLTSKNPDCGLITTINGGGISGPEYLNGLEWVGTWSTYIPRKTIKAVGLFDDKMKIGEDIDYTYRVIKAGLQIYRMNLWFEHHQIRSSPHAPQDHTIVQESAKYFRQKHKLGEFSNEAENSGIN